MAIVHFGPSVIGIRGTIGGITFSANKTAPYCKQWARPPSSSTPKQTLTRSTLADNATLWAALDQGVKDNWDSFAAAPNELDYDPWSFQRFLTGFQWFARAQQRRSSLSLANPGPVPSGTAATSITSLRIDLQSTFDGVSVVQYDDNQFAPGEAIILFLSITPGTGARDSFRNWKLVLAQVNPPNGGVSIHAAWRAAFGAIPAGWKAFALAYKQADPGNRSTAAATDTIVYDPGPPA
jgi:hypothetical protein